VVFDQQPRRNDAEVVSITLEPPITTVPLRVLVVDDHPVVCDGVRLLLSRDNGTEVVGSAASATTAVQALTDLQPDVVLLDVRLPGVDNAQLVSRLRAFAPRCPVLLFTAHTDAPELQAALASGASGCLLKDVSTEQLATALRDVVAGRTVLDPRLEQRPDGGLQERLDALRLTRREHEVVRLVATGLSNPEIADELGLTRNTVKTYLQTAMQKLDARNRVDAIGKAREARLL
jgi:two-component system nitrate/nitrite response regulator NarL